MFPSCLSIQKSQRQSSLSHWTSNINQRPKESSQIQKQSKCELQAPLLSLVATVVLHFKEWLSPWIRWYHPSKANPDCYIQQH
jgi:hypothetical protein